MSESFKRQFHWIDHTRMSFSNWAPGEPNGHNSETIVEDVVEMYPYTYGYIFGFVCHLKIIIFVQLQCRWRVERFQSNQ